jgi:predicted nucleic acid-binding protein
MMVLADTSIWIEHFRRHHAGLADRLAEGMVLMHPFIAGELACGNLKNRVETLADFHALPQSTVASHEEVLSLLAARRLWGRGFGWIDAHLLSSALLSRCEFWTLDAKLAKAARDLGVSA